jgi:hypothetical protein
MPKYSSYQFSLFRIYLGGNIFLVLFFSIPSSEALWSNQGMVSNPAFNLNYGVFPNVLNKVDEPYQVIIFITILLAISLLFIAGISRRLSALILWYGWTCLINRNNLITNPAIPYTGWLLLACAVIPRGESIAFTGKNDQWYLPPIIFKTAWFLFAFGYFISGIDKLNSSSWYDGSALIKILECPLAYDFTNRINLLPSWMMKCINWLVIIIELTVFPLSVFTKTRKWAWILATCIQSGILISLNIAPIVFGMFSIHILLFDREWFAGRIIIPEENYVGGLTKNQQVG